jgi:putative hemolysin
LSKIERKARGGDIMLGEIITLIILIAVNAFFAASEISIISLREITLAKRASEGDKKAIQLLGIIKEPSKFLATIQVGVTLASFFTSASAAVGLSKSFDNMLRRSSIGFVFSNSGEIALIVVTIMVSFLSLLFGELIPKRAALRKSDFIASKSVGIIRIVEIIARPLVILLTYCTNAILKLFYADEVDSEQAITEEEIRMMINVGEEKGIFRKAETDMINSIFEFDNTRVSDIMTPRPDMIALDVASSFEEVVEIIIEEKYSRIPVYKENIDNIIGILYTKDIIDYMALKKDSIKFNLRDMMREAFFVTEYKKIDILLKEMQKRNVHISIVIDEYGTTAGLVTIEDLVEEIVGNIFDEYDIREDEISIKGTDEFEIDGRLNMSELNELLHSNYSENYDTVSGLILDNLGRFPKEGESIRIDEYVFDVKEIENRRIKKIFIKKNI